MTRTRLGQVLLESGAINGRQLDTALHWQQRWGGRIGNALVHLGMIPEMELVRALGHQLGLPIIDLTGHQVPEEVLRLVPEPVIVRHRVLPLRVLAWTRRAPMMVAVNDPFDLAALDAVAFATSRQVRPVIAGRTQLDVAIQRHLRGAHPLDIDLPDEPETEMELVHHPAASVRKILN